MSKKQQVEISRNTIEVLENLIKINERIWIVPDQKQSVVSKYKNCILTSHIKETFPSNLFPEWGKNLQGFGIYDGNQFVKILKGKRRPVFDFSKLKSDGTLIILDGKDTTRVEIPTVKPDMIERMEDEFQPPPFDVHIQLNWNEILKLLKMTNVINNPNLEFGSDGKDAWINTSDEDGIRTGTSIECWKPKKPFRYLLNSELLKLSKGDYEIHFSESGLSQWVNLTDRRYIYYISLNRGCWFNKPKTPTQLMLRNKDTSHVKTFSPKEYKSAGEYSKAVNRSWQKAVDAIIETGDLLDEAKKKFSGNEMVWQSFLNNLPFGLRTVERLICISRNKPLLCHPKIYNHLPPNWGTLYEIVNIGNGKPITIYENQDGETSKEPKTGFTPIELDKEDFIIKGIQEERLSINNGNGVSMKVPIIRPDMTRADIINFKKKIEHDYIHSTDSKSTETEEPTPKSFITIKVCGDVSVKSLELTKYKIEQLLKDKPEFVMEENKSFLSKLNSTT